MKLLYIIMQEKAEKRSMEFLKQFFLEVSIIFLIYLKWFLLLTIGQKHCIGERDFKLVA